MEYISDDDEEEQANRYQTDRIMLPSPRVSVEEREVGFLTQKSLPTGTNCLQSKCFRCRSWCETAQALRRESWRRTPKLPPQLNYSLVTLVEENSTQLLWRGTLRSDSLLLLLLHVARFTLPPLPAKRVKLFASEGKDWQLKVMMLVGMKMLG